MSAEILQIDVDAAQRRAERIRFHATNANEAMQSLIKLIAQAQDLEDHLTLGYASWTAYVADVFGQEPMRLAGEVRRALTPQLSDTGMSNRAIASVLGVSEGTIRNDLSGAQNYAPAPVESEGFTVNPSTGEIIDGPTMHAEPIPEPVTTEHTFTEKIKTVTGLDGKEYKRPEPKQVPRGDEANRLNAIQASKSIGRSLEALQYLNYEKARTGIVTDWWPIGKHEVPPEQANYFTPAELRKLAQGLNTTADLLEAQHVH